MPPSSRSALLLVNRHARSGSEAIDGAVQVLERAGIALRRVDLPNRHQIANLVREHAASCDLVILSGGDGTLNAEASALMATRLPLGILPLGTANDLARTLDLPADPAAAAAVIATGHLRSIDLGEANGVPCFNVAHIGLTTEIDHRLTSDSKKRWGRLGYAIAAWRIVGRVRPFTATMQDDGRDETFRTLQVTVGNGVFYAGGLRVAEGARPDDGCLDVYSLETDHWWKLVALLPGLTREPTAAKPKCMPFARPRLPSPPTGHATSMPMANASRGLRRASGCCRPPCACSCRRRRQRPSEPAGRPLRRRVETWAAR